jgi:lysophospholipase L1-like esterase
VNLKLRVTLLLISLGFGLILLILLFAEVALRFARPDLGSSLSPDPVLGWTSTEYEKFDPLTPELPGKKRLLFLGDSFLAGSGVKKLDQRFPVLLGRSNPQWEIAILASGGWSIDQELWAFRQKGKSWKPDLVFLAFCANNDISSILTHHYGLPGLTKPYYRIADTGEMQLFDATGELIGSMTVPVSSTVVGEGRSEPILKRSYLVRLIAALLHWDARFKYQPYDYPKVDPVYKLFPSRQEKFEEIYRGQQRLTWSPQDGVNHISAYIHENFDLNSRMWELFERLLVDLRDEVEQSGSRLVVILLPAIFLPQDLTTIVGGSYEKQFDTPAGAFTFRSAEPRDRMTEICRRVNVLLFDPTREFSEIVVKRGISSQVWPDSTDRHFSAEGHKIMNDLMKDWIADTFHTDLSNVK